MKITTLTDIRNVVTDNVDDQVADKIMAVVRDYVNQAEASKGAIVSKLVVCQQERKKLSMRIEELSDLGHALQSMSDEIEYFISEYDETTENFERE